MVSLQLFHTCRAGDEEQVLKEAPFKAESTGKQWLGDGYYFWVESIDYAHKWGRRYEDNYCIVEYRLEIQRQDLLDLVGSPNDQFSFNKLIEAAVKKFEDKDNQIITVSAYINFLQKIHAWGWLATKLADFGKAHQIKNHAAKIAPSGELVFLNPRIQLCLHTEPTDAKVALSAGVLVHPPKSYKQIKSLEVIK